MSTGQVAKQYRVNISTVARWCRRNMLAGAYRIGGKGNAWAIPREALRGFEPPGQGRRTDRMGREIG